MEPPSFSSFSLLNCLLVGYQTLSAFCACVVAVGLVTTGDTMFPQCGCAGRQDPIPFYVAGPDRITFAQARVLAPPDVDGATCVLARAPATEYQRIQMAVTCPYSETCWLAALAIQGFVETPVCNSRRSDTYNETACRELRLVFRNLDHDNAANESSVMIPVEYLADGEPSNKNNDNQFRLVINSYASGSGGWLFAVNGQEIHKPLFQCCHDDIPSTCPFWV